MTTTVSPPDTDRLPLADLKVKAAPTDHSREVLTESACSLIVDLHRTFQPALSGLLSQRQVRQAQIDAGQLPDFLPETSHIRSSSWTIRGIPDDLQDRRVEITGPVDRKMVINALNANVKVFMADFEDSLSPRWDSIIQGQLNLRDAVRGTIDYTDPNSGKHYSLRPDPAVLICRVRGLHLVEKHLVCDDEPLPGALVDFALYFVHNYQALLEKGSGPYFYLPKLQSHHEARWWDEVFRYTEQRFNLPVGTIKATVLIETLPAVFEMDEILYELRDHIVGLNCGRWDYIFSYIKTLKNHPDRILPDRQVVTMEKPFLNAYSRLLIRTCHRRGAFAMGGMSAFIPSKEPERQAFVLDKVRQDKTMEARNGHDGSWIAHPGLADPVLAVFAKFLGSQSTNQLHISREADSPITAQELLLPCSGPRTESGMRNNIRVAVQYIEAWINGQGCVPIYGLMEDAATAEISRASIWQWIRHQQKLDDGTEVTPDLFKRLLSEEMAVVRKEAGEERFRHGRFVEASELLAHITLSDELVEFLTLPGYDYLG